MRLLHAHGAKAPQRALIPATDVFVPRGTPHAERQPLTRPAAAVLAAPSRRTAIAHSGGYCAALRGLVPAADALVPGFSPPRARHPHLEVRYSAKRPRPAAAKEFQGG